MSSRDPLEGAAVSIVGLYVAIAIVAFAITIWATIKIANLVLRVMVHHPHNKALWVALGIAALLLLVALVFGGAYPAADGLAVAGVGVLAATSRAVELYYDELSQPEVTKEHLINQVLFEPWWSMEAA